MTKEKKTRRDEDRLQQMRQDKLGREEGKGCQKKLHMLGRVHSKSGREYLFIVPPLSANI